MVYDPSKRRDMEQEVMRNLTLQFIQNDPTDIQLTPHIRTGQPGGGFKNIPQPKRRSQTFKLINQGSGSGKSVQGDGINTSNDMILLGLFDAKIAIGDTWTDPDGITWSVTGLIPRNGYEVKATVTAQGAGPIGG